MICSDRRGRRPWLCSNDRGSASYNSNVQQRRIAAILFVLATHAFAQLNTGEIAGLVVDSSGGALPSATVTAKSTDTGRQYAGVTNRQGEYLVAQIPAGSYKVTVLVQGFKQSESPAIDVHAGEHLRQDFTLQVGDITETLVVDVSASGVQAETADVRNVIQREEVVSLPLKGRQFMDLAILSEGVVRPPGGTRGEAMQQAGNLVNVLGQRSGHNLYLIDGATVTDEYFNNLVIAPSIDFIQEVNVLKTSYSPEFGGKSGAVVNVITRSGANAFAGTLFELVRNNVFDAKNFFAAASDPTPPFRQNQFGGSGGGPLARNKTFFFLSYEGQQIRKSLTQTFSVPTAAIRGGDFSGLATIYDPASSQRAAFTGNRIPLSRLDGVAGGLLQNVPRPNLPGLGQNLRAVETQRSHFNTYGARLDHQFSEKDSVFARLSVFDARQFDPFGSGVLQETLLPGFGRNLGTHSVNAVAGWTHTFSGDLLNELRAAVLTASGGQSSPNAGNAFASRNGIQGVTTNPLDTGFPQFSFGGQFSTMGDAALFTRRADSDVEVYDNVMKRRGNHTLRAGAYFMRFHFQPENPNNARGVFTFTPRWTSSSAGLADGNAFADFLLGYPTTAQAGLGRATMDAHTNWAHFYVQDGWQITPNLRFDAGIRYEHNSNMMESGNRMAAIDPSVPGGRFVVAGDSAGPLQPPIPYVSASAAGWDNSLLAHTGPRLAPRGGIVWKLPEPAKSVVRASFGIYPNQAAYSIITNFAQNLPFFVTKTVNTTATAAPPFTTSNALATNALGTAGGSNLNHDFMVEYNEVWNLSLEREIAASTSVSISYIGSRTVHADSSTVLNVPVPGPGAIAARRPIPQLSQFNTIRWDGWAKYDAFAATLTRRFARGLTYNLNWTWSHSIDDASDPGATLNEANLPQNVFDTRSEKASSSFDHRHRVVVSFVYQLPLAKQARGFRHAALAEWQASGNFSAQSGAPLTINIASDQANIGAGPAQRPNVVGDPNGGPKTPDQWFNTSVFSLPALYTFGNTPRNTVIGPGMQEVNLSLQKGWTLGEKRRLEFRAEAYNLLNHPNFNIPNRTAFTANFGRISSAQDSRQLQLGAKLSF